MTPNKTTIKEFFEGEKCYTIPVYQRAYSWEEKQWEQFLEDLEEASQGDRQNNTQSDNQGNHYFFGNILLEKLAGSKSSDIIDGQQRITTIVIFVRSVIDVLRARAQNGERLKPDIENEDFLHYIEEDYLSNRGKSKLVAVEYDEDYFKNVIVNGGQDNEQTPSQKRIKKAKEYFAKKLAKKKTDDILAIFKVMEKAEVLSIPFTNRKDSVLMFELQNNRGKDLTAMEKLKSYLFYQIYTYAKSHDETESYLKDITQKFEEMYRVMNDIEWDADTTLNDYNVCCFGFDYRENDNDKNYKKELKNAEDKIAWIQEYVLGLKMAFLDYKTFMDSKSAYKEYLLELDVRETYPFILKAYQLFRNDEESLEQTFKALENIAFRDRFINKGNADLASRLNKVLKNFDSLDSLTQGLQEVANDWNYYWSNQKFYNDCYENERDELLSDHSYTRRLQRLVPYILMRYETYLRAQETQSKGYFFDLKDLKEPTIEHIAPQTEKNEKVSSGYDEYDKYWHEDCYLNCIGNFLLVDKSHNSSIGNKPFSEKLASYTYLEQQKEIKGFASNDGKLWGKESINNRHVKILEFIKETWSFGE
ncbi:MAG TPA: DUF262 domain-containing HNH endonuclease family protein [Candidatus Helicobacter avicola]|nr:DUF262 domain-containing HNH endonuclease family protein [Candidatus Helicobacter avicola]